jgi:dTDP-4-amino-4,6-dideoxygalactose transaminase
MKKIGGFFALDLPDRVVEQSVAALWTLSERPHVCYSNGRSALNALLKLGARRCLWLPAYCCESLAQAVKGTGLQIRYYPITKTLSPDFEHLSRAFEPADLVLVIDYFGRPADLALREFAKARPDIDWIEDRSQALDPGGEDWADYILYSPRKLLGVPDGGILVSRGKPLPSPGSAGRKDVDFIRAALLRYEDIDEQDNAVWHLANRDYEVAMAVSDMPMSRLTHHILQTADASWIAGRRRTNYQYLMRHLADLAVLPHEELTFTPLGFPIWTKARQKLAGRLAAQGIFAAHHWPSLPSEKTDYPKAHKLAERILTLPCDQRYDQNDMAQIVAAVRGVI